MASLSSCLVIQSIPMAAAALATEQFPPPGDLNEGRVLIELAVVRLPLVVGEDQRVLGRATSWSRDRGVALKQAVTLDPQAGEHRAAEQDRRDQGRALDVLDDPGAAGRLEHGPDRGHKIRPVVGVPVPLGEVAISLTGRARMDRVK